MSRGVERDLVAQQCSAPGNLCAPHREWGPYKTPRIQTVSWRMASKGTALPAWNSASALQLVCKQLDGTLRMPPHHLQLALTAKWRWRKEVAWGQRAMTTRIPWGQSKWAPPKHNYFCCAVIPQFKASAESHNSVWAKATSYASKGLCIGGNTLPCSKGKLLQGYHSSSYAVSTALLHLLQPSESRTRIFI